MSHNGIINIFIQTGGMPNSPLLKAVHELTGVYSPVLDLGVTEDPFLSQKSTDGQSKQS